MRYDIYSLKKLLKSLTEKYDGISEVYLFGSRLHRTRSTRSDVDLLITVDETVIAEDIRDFALEECPALDFFLIEKGLATSCANSSKVRASNKKQLIQKLGAIKIWNKSKSFLDVDIDWDFKVIKGMEIIMTNLITSEPYPSKAEAISEETQTDTELESKSQWSTVKEHPIWVLSGVACTVAMITFGATYQMRIVPLEREIKNLTTELSLFNKVQPSKQTSQSNHSNNITSNGNHNTNTITVTDKKSYNDFINNLSAEKEINLPLLSFLSKRLEGTQIVHFAYQPNYLSNDVLKQYNQYEITNKITIKKILELKDILIQINNKITILHNVNNKSIQGNIGEMTSAVINFVPVTDLSKKAIALYISL